MVKTPVDLQEGISTKSHCPKGAFFRQVIVSKIGKFSVKSQNKSDRRNSGGREKKRERREKMREREREERKKEDKKEKKGEKGRKGVKRQEKGRKREEKREK